MKLFKMNTNELYGNFHMFHDTKLPSLRIGFDFDPLTICLPILF